MRSILAALVLGLLSASSDAAQAHPCDQPFPQQQTIASGAPQKLTFCQPLAEKPEALVAWIDGKVFDLLPITAKSAPNALGLVLYETQLFFQVAKGTHTLEAATYNRNAVTGQLQFGARSSPFSFGAEDDTPKPSAPLIVGVTR